MSKDEGGILFPGGIMPLSALDHAEDMDWLTNSTLCIIVVGASGDLAKKKTYPSLLNLYDDNLLPKHVRIFGLARSQMKDEELRDRLRPYLTTSDHSEEVVERFLKRCVYHSSPSYGDVEAYGKLKDKMKEYELVYASDPTMERSNRLFYFAIPPSVFADTAIAIKKTGMQEEGKGWTRLIVEKPFGRDLESFETLNKTLAEHFSEEHIYRIDHYLGKELVQNLQVLRFSNIWLEKVWDNQNVQCVILTFKEPFGTDGRGGYFDQYGIIRDICQNHLLQVMCLLAMETPTIVEGPGAGKAVRDAKVAVLNAIKPLTLDDVVLGQYEGYADDPTIENKDTNTPTFATLRFMVNTPRWHGVPFIMKAGKALNERKAEMRIQFKDAPAAEFIFQGDACPRNELVMRMQPHEAIYLKNNVKSPGFAAKPVQSELEVNYESRFFDHTKESNPDAYTRLILDVLQGRQAAFVRDDELRRAWEIFSPLLHQIEKEGVRPIIYKRGIRAPIEADVFVKEKGGYIRNEDYVFYDGNVARKTEGTSAAPKPPNAPHSKVADEDLCDVGVFGLSVVGANVALNIAEHGFKVAVGNRSHDKVSALTERARTEGNLPIFGTESPEDFIDHLKKPRKVFILVQAGRPVDDTISSLARYMERDDIIADGGDEWYPNSIRRAKFLEPKGISFICMGISGGESEVRYGSSIMAGGEINAFKLVEPILSKIAAPSMIMGPCVGCLGPVGAGNYVKMVHNGIEYADLQLIAESYDVMKTLLQMNNEEIADTFDKWNTGELSSYLLKITSAILRKKDTETGGYILDHIRGTAGMKGTGRWTVEEGAKNGVAVPTISGALNARILSALSHEREKAANLFEVPSIKVGDPQQILRDLQSAMYASRICSYAQGLYLIKKASDENKWNVQLAECIRLWSGGSVMRSELLLVVHSAFNKNPGLSNLMFDPDVATELSQKSKSWRCLVACCVTHGIPCPSLCGSLTYFDSYRRSDLPANLIQAQRDFFGNHTYERIDREGRFHTMWTDAHKEIADTTERTAGEKLQTEFDG